MLLLPMWLLLTLAVVDVAVANVVAAYTCRCRMLVLPMWLLPTLAIADVVPACTCRC